MNCKILHTLLGWTKLFMKVTILETSGRLINGWLKIVEESITIFYYLTVSIFSDVDSMTSGG
jgi:hypothetical protein